MARRRFEETGRAHGGFVLPKLLRKPARIAERFVKGEWTPPRFANAVVTSLLLSSSLAYGMVEGGHTPGVLKAVTARTGFAVDQVHVTGNRETSEIDILDRLELDGWTSLVGFDAADARDRIASLPWVEQASVRKIYPRTLEVKVVEREPFAIWQHGASLTVIKKTGEPITEFNGRGRNTLPLVVGAGAPEQAAAVVAKLAEFPALAARVKSYVRVGDRRWDLRLDNGVTVKLPEHGEEAALGTVARVDATQSLLSRDIASVDLRFSDRMVVLLTADASKARKDMLDKEAKAARKRKQGART